MTTKPICTHAVACAILASIACADDLRPGPANPSDTASSRWVFGTCTGDPFAENFDSYAVGNLCDQSTWEEWPGSVDVCGEVSTEQANSGPNSLKIIGNVGGRTGQGDDTVHQHHIVGGVWTYSVMTFVPNDATGSAYFLLLNGYPPESFNWSTQIRFDADLDLVESEWGRNVPLIRGRWVELRIEIDIPSDTQDKYYDGVLFDEGSSWRHATGRGTLRAIDLYANEPPVGITGMYWDDFSLTSSGCGGCEPCDMNCDGRIDVFDIEPFLDLLFEPNPDPCNTCTGDVNGDGSIDALDIEPFLECLFP